MLSQRAVEDPTLYEELIRRGLPADYARRTADELDDHRADLLADVRDEGAVEVCLGEPRRLAKQIARDYRKRSWVGRWPLLSFFVAPPLLLSGAWYLAVLGLIGVVTACGEPGRTLWAAWVFFGAITAVFSYLIPALLAWKIGRWALDSALSNWGVVASCLMIGLFNCLIVHGVRVDPEDASRGLNFFGLYFGPFFEPAGFNYLPIACRQLLQLLAPIVVGAVLLWSDLRRRRACAAGCSLSDPRRFAA